MKLDKVTKLLRFGYSLDEIQDMLDEKEPEKQEIDKYAKRIESDQGQTRQRSKPSKSEKKGAGRRQEYE